jgi:hypothetical protein
MEVKVTKIPHKRHQDEYVFYKGNTKVVTEKRDWTEVEYKGKPAWAYYGEKTTYISVKRIA